MIVRTAVLVAALGLLFVGMYHTVAPTRFEAFARVKIEESVPAWSTNYDTNLFGNEIELIRSEQILGKVRERFNLRKNWGELQKPGHLSAPGSRELDVSPVRCTSFLEVKASAVCRDEAAGIANTIVDALKDYHQAEGGNRESRISVQLVDPATPSPRPSFPNRSLGGVSLLLGALLAVVWFVAARKPQTSH